MKKIDWSDSYRLGDNELDEQHRAIFDVVDRLAEAISSGARHEIMGVFSRLVDYAKSHFSWEEAYMEKLGYAGLEAHKLEHIAFLEEVMALWQNFLQGDPEAVGRRLLNFLHDWLTEHIGRADRACCATLRDKPSSD